MPLAGLMKAAFSMGAKSAWRGAGLIGRSAMTGAGIGAAWGAMSDDTSVLGGAFAGATLGLGYPGLKAAYRVGVPGVMAARGMGMGWMQSLGWGWRLTGQLAGRYYRMLGKHSAAYIGKGAVRGYNAFSALYGGIRTGLAGG